MNGAVARGLAAHLNVFDGATRAAGARLGWKVAFNVPMVQERLGLSGSLVAGLTAATLHDGARPYSLSRLSRPALEAEVAVWIGHDVSPDDSTELVAASIAAWAPAIELVDFNRSLDELELILTEGVFHRAVVLGKRVEVSEGAELKGHEVHVELGGVTVCDVDAREATGHAPEVLSHLARLLAPHGHLLKAGDVVILGTMNPFTVAVPDSAFSVSIGGLGSVSLSCTS
ncbi:MAG TPA: fumarylacetoacetate hydrolase family protein [Polyangiaceae bacterium]|nr:fumarylacetoacetate hydrolase family protein [Polyangiaceae bacterium]